MWKMYIQSIDVHINKIVWKIQLRRIRKINQILKEFEEYSF